MAVAALWPTVGDSSGAQQHARPSNMELPQTNQAGNDLGRWRPVRASSGWWRRGIENARDFACAAGASDKSHGIQAAGGALDREEWVRRQNAGSIGVRRGVVRGSFRGR